jgi:hypothetical protein
MEQEQQTSHIPPAAEVSKAEGQLMMQVHELEVRLFRLKQIDELLGEPTTPASEQLAVREEKKAILASVKKPVGVPISVFRAQSEANAEIIAQLFQDLQAGKIHLS